MKTITIHHSARRAQTLTSGTIGDVVRWLEAYVRILHPSCDIEYWSDLTFERNMRSMESVLGALRAGGDSEHVQPACFAVAGHSCGDGILVRVAIKSSNRIEHLGFAKMFGSVQHAWEVAETVSAVLTQVLYEGTQPTIVDLVHSFHGMQDWPRCRTRKPDVGYPILARVFSEAIVPTIVVTDASGSQILQCEVARGVRDGEGVQRVLTDLVKISESLEMDVRICADQLLGLTYKAA